MYGSIMLSSATMLIILKVSGLQDGALSFKFVMLCHIDTLDIIIIILLLLFSH